jgi:hypothetical protein
MSETVIVSIIAAIGAVAVAWIGRKLVTIQKDTKASREQVENSHNTNLRDDLDGRHGEVMRVLDRLYRQFEGMGSDIRGIRKDIGRLESSDDRLDERIHDLEKKEGK